MRPTKLDLELSEWLDFLEIPRLVVATKADKLSGNRRSSSSAGSPAHSANEPVILASAVTGIGCKEIWKRVMEGVRGSEVAL